MIVLTDNKPWAEQLLINLVSDSGQTSALAGVTNTVPTANWFQLTADQLPPAEQRLWAGLDGGAHLNRLDFTCDPELAGWDCLVIIDQAKESQYDALRRLDPARLPGSVACLAAVGSGFHGHNSRSWQTQRGNLHLSTLCDPNLDAATCGLAMTTLPAVALVDALLAEGPWVKKPGIKWVNDILIDGHKVAGVLTATQSLRGQLTSLALGLGVNVENTPEVLPTAFVPAAGSLAESLASGKPSTVGSILAGCLKALSRRLDIVRQQGPQSLVQAYRNHSLILGRSVVIWPDSSSPDQKAPTPAEPLVSGVVQAIGDDLSLTLKGHPEVIRCGRLALNSD